MSTGSEITTEREASTRRRTTVNECLLIIEFLETPLHYKIMTGNATQGASVHSGQPLTKQHGTTAGSRKGGPMWLRDLYVGYTLLADYINSRLSPVPAWCKGTARSRYESYMRKYKAADRWEGNHTGGQTGQGLTASDLRKGKVGESNTQLCNAGFNHHDRE